MKLNNLTAMFALLMVLISGMQLTWDVASAQSVPCNPKIQACM